MDHSVRFIETGSGETLLLVPGLGGSMSFWQKLIPRLSRSFRVVSFDHPGFGGSPPGAGDCSVASLADLCVRLLDQLGVQRAHIVGHSMGGAVAQALVLDYPERAGSVVFSSTWARPEGGFVTAFKDRAEILRREGIAAYARAQTHAVMSAEQIAKAPDEVEAREREFLETAPSIPLLLSRIDALLAFDRCDDLGRISHRCMVVCCRDDRVVPPCMSRVLHRSLPGADFVELPEGGHFAPLNDPRTYLEAILPFLSAAKSPEQTDANAEAEEDKNASL